jgi:chorismate-pyruvate lyase
MSLRESALLDEVLPLLMLADGGAAVGRELQSIPAAALPQPHRRLLDHDKDMTGTLAAYFGDELRVEPLEVRGDARELVRRVRLLTRGAGRVAEYGAIRIHLERFPAAARPPILAADLPLGQILQEHGIPIRARPRAFWRLIEAGPLRASFGIDHAEILFGRFNVLLDGHGAPLAEALEILPRLEAEGPPELPLP